MVALRLDVLDLLSLTRATLRCRNLVLLAKLELFIACLAFLAVYWLFAADLRVVAVFPGVF